MQNEQCSGKIYTPVRRRLHIEVIAETRGARGVCWPRALPNPVVLHLLDLLRRQHVRFLALSAVERARNGVKAKEEKGAHSKNSLVPHGTLGILASHRAVDHPPVWSLHVPKPGVPLGQRLLHRPLSRQIVSPVT